MEILKYGKMEIRIYGNMKIWKKWKYGKIENLKYRNMETWKY